MHDHRDMTTTNPPEPGKAHDRRRRPPFRLNRPRNGIAKRAFSALVNPAVERALAFHKLNAVYDDVCQDTTDEHFAAKALASLKVAVDVSDRELARIPDTGPLIIVANHPFGAIDGMILMSILHRARPDAKVMANFLLHRIRELREMLICVDPFEGDGARARNLGPLKEAIRHVKAGGALGCFPAGEVAHLDLHQRAIVDPRWSETVAGIVRRTGATVVPLYFHGRNSPLFQLLGMIHPRLRTVMLPRELLRKHSRTIKVKVGHPIPAGRLAEFPDDRRTIDYLRMRTYLQAAGLHPRSRRGVAPTFTPTEPEPQLADIIPAVDPAKLREEIDGLPAEAKLVAAGEQDVYAAPAHQIPLCLREIGRLREISFRAVGEGTGKPLDLDRFDETYLHLFIWERNRLEIVGAYRLGQTDLILPRHGIAGLYTSTLFDYDRSLMDQIDPALEMGRSFVRTEYQKSYAPLMNLWKGIARFMCLNPRYVRLLGPVSISNDYNDLSRRLMVEFLMANRFARDLAALCRARHPMRRPKRKRIVKGVDSVVVKDIDEVSDIIADIEREPKGVPILLKQYLRLGAQLLGFNIDPDFGDVLDGLILIDLRDTDQRILAKYMGRQAMAEFFTHHAKA